jgi:N-carbamoylputrescine amidase
MLKGADLLLVPHLIGLPTVASFAVALRARAIDSGLHVVAAGMRDAHNHNGTQDGLGPTCILGPDGEVIAQTRQPSEDVILATIDLDPVTPNQRKVRETRADRRMDVYAREYAALAAALANGS